MLWLWSLSWQIIPDNPSWPNLITWLLKANHLSWLPSEQIVTKRKDEIDIQENSYLLQPLKMEGEDFLANNIESSRRWKQPSIYSQQGNRNCGPIISRNCILPTTWMSRNQILLHSLQKGMQAHWHLDLILAQWELHEISDLQNCKIINLCGLSH